MKNDLTELVFILDRSGSMAGLEADTIGGFNAMLERQKKEEGRAFVSTILFSNQSEVLHDRVDLAEVGPISEADYRVGGCTALLDAIGDAVRHIENIHKYTRPEDVPAHTLFVITTDGMENASRRYSADRVKSMIRAKEELGWEFLFLAANIDAVETAEAIGIRGERSANYTQTEEGTRALYDCMSDIACEVRASRPIRKDWKDKLRCKDNR